MVFSRRLQRNIPRAAWLATPRRGKLPGKEDDADLVRGRRLRAGLGRGDAGGSGQPQGAAGRALSPDGNTLAVVPRYSRVVVLLAPRGGRKLGKPRELAGHSGQVARAAFAPDGRLGSVGREGTFCLWSADGS